MSEHAQIRIPQPVKPYPLEGYWLPGDAEKLLEWSSVSQRMAEARNYWIATTNPDGRAHVVPVWGVWLDSTLHFGGSPDTRWARNLLQRPYVVVHLDDSVNAVILEGTVTRLTDPDSEQMTRIDDAYEAKYDMRHGPPISMLHLHKALAWTTMDWATRWVFEESETP
ncbi:MAG: pyridoxamine 5'-phosphate oxidase family protein [Anaerolineae bacterium]|nr:pyridoxamine 5'-phosphate oxidase family protein [Anaerolineae bacterium]